MIHIKKITSQETYIVRHPVLRQGKPIESCIFDADDLDSTIHFGLFTENEIVGVVSIFEKNRSEFIQEKQLQMRGMAILPTFQNRGLGRLLINEVEKYALSERFSVIWFNARENAVDFYEKQNYKKIGTKFDIHGIGFHYLMYKRM